MESCILCQKNIQEGDDSVKLREKGSEGINNASMKRGDVIKAMPGDIIHKECRRRYCNPNVIIKETKSTDVSDKSHRKLRSTGHDFVFSEHCLFCGTYAINTTDKKKCVEIFAVRTMDFQKSIQVAIAKRNDKWAEEVQARIDSIHDLPAADALYHQQCNVNFRTLKNIPTVFDSLRENNDRKRTPGRPTNDNQEYGFQRVVQYLTENDNEQVTVAALVKQMQVYCGDLAYSAIHMKKKLQKHFGSSIIITEINGISNVVTFKTTATSILSDFYKQPKNQDPYTEKKLIIETASKLIKSDIKSIDASKLIGYPVASDVSSCSDQLDYIPESLKLLLRNMFSEKEADLKIAAIGQAIIQATRPRVILAPLQIGLGVQMHHQFGSKFLIDTLFKLGFSSSYSEVQKFELNAAASNEMEVEGVTEDHMIQFVADNVDHNLRTIDGHNTFHGMGIIATVTPLIKKRRKIPRLQVSIEEITALGKIDIHFHKLNHNPLKSLSFEPISPIDENDYSWKLDLLSHVVWPLRSPRLGWSAMMQVVQTGEFPGQSDVIFLPMIDMNPSDISCIYSTLKFICKEANRHGVHPIVTFDQPLYWKALMIILGEQKDSEVGSVILRLGGFHMEMSFLGCIGYLMRGSGLTELLESVYAPSAVGHMLTGKAVARATRGHFLVHTVLNAIIISEVFGISLFSETEHPEKSGNEETRYDNDGVTVDFNQNDLTTPESRTEKEVIDPDLQNAAALFDSLLNGEISPEYVQSHQSIKQIYDKLETYKHSLLKFRTSSLWLQYIHMIDILKRFITAERTGNWNGHLKAVGEMLPYFAASGHNLYAKSAYIYLQSMQDLEKTLPDVFYAFQSGHHIVRRSDRYWAGLSTDLVIEQVLMRSVKATGGMTRGRGMSESQRAQWLLSMPACADFNNAMQQLTDTNFSTSDQHKESGTARKERDHRDMITFLSFFADRNPFLREQPLRHLETGETAEKTVNVDQAHEVGVKIIKSMVGQNVANFVFKKSYKVVPMDTKLSIKDGEDIIHVDPQLLFQRLVAAANGTQDDISDMFRYELSTFPSSLFEPSGLFRAAQKPALADAIFSLGDCSSALPDDDQLSYVIDGGSLLHQIPWSRGSSFSSICTQYKDYVLRHFPNPTVVFDGYLDGPSTKDMTHLRRTGAAVGTKVLFTENTPFKSKKEHFLANTENKQCFINMLSDLLLKNGCQTKHAIGDADVLIAKTAVERAVINKTVLVGEDTDLLVLLLFHCNLDSNDIYFKSMKSGLKGMKIWDIRKTKTMLGIDMCKVMPFIHSISGCDTTSRMFGIGKSAVLQKLRNNAHLFETALKFMTPGASEKDIIEAGEDIISSVYGGFPLEGLDILRYRKFTSKVMQNTSFVQVHTLPPTSDAASFHSKRVYLQTQEWIETTNTIDPLKWGWQLKDGKLYPVRTNLPPAPARLIKVIRCKCKQNCDSRKCSCRKHGLECTISCSDCKGVSCSNSNLKDITEEEILSDDL